MSDSPDVPGRERPSLVDVVLVATIVAISVSAWASLTLAQLGERTTLLVALLAAAVLVGIAIVVVRHLPRLSCSWGDAALAGGLLLGALWMFLPGFPYSVADKDPGVYVNIAALISEEGATRVDDVASRADLDLPLHLPSGQRFNAVWHAPGDREMAQPQFYHLWPALQANVRDVAGATGVRSLTPVLGALSVVLVGLATRRAFGLGAGAVAGTLLAANMMQVWAAKTPGTEIYAQLLLVLALWGVVVSVRTRWPPAAAVAGFATAFVFLTRPDGVLLVLLASGLAAVFLIMRRADRLVGWFAAGSALVLPFAVYQAWWRNVGYSINNNVPTLRTAAVLAVLPLLVAAAFRLAGGGRGRRAVAWVVDVGRQRRTQVICGIVLSVGFAVFLVVGLARPELLGADWAVSQRSGDVRTYNEDNLIRLGWFFTPVGLGLLWLGTAVLACSRWFLDRWLLVLPGLVLLPVYVVDARIASRMMWWTRRFIPVAIVVVVILIALGVVWLWRRRGPLRWPSRALAAGLTVYMLVGLLDLSLPLREHREFEGTSWAASALAELPGEETGVYLWLHPNSTNVFHPVRLFGVPMWFEHGHISAILPLDVDGDDLQQWQETFADHPVYLLSTGGEAPEFADVGDDPAAVIDIRTPVWEERNGGVPDEPIEDDVHVTIVAWELNG